MSFLEEPVVLVLIGAIPSFVLGFLAYRRSIKVDKVAELSGIASSQTAGIEQVIGGLNTLTDSLQVDNKILRENIAQCALRLERALTEKDELLKQVERLSREEKKEE